MISALKEGEKVFTDKISAFKEGDSSVHRQDQCHQGTQKSIHRQDQCTQGAHIDGPVTDSMSASIPSLICFGVKFKDHALSHFKVEVENNLHIHFPDLFRAKGGYIIDLSTLLVCRICWTVPLVCKTIAFFAMFPPHFEAGLSFD